MGLHTKTHKQIDAYYEVVSIDKTKSKRNLWIEVLNLKLFNINVFVIIERNF